LLHCHLNDAIRHAVELEAFNKAELKINEGGGYLRSATEQENKDETVTLLKTMQQGLQLNCMPNGIVEIDGSRLFYPQPHVSINQ
jgi:hypothetical protein